MDGFGYQSLTRSADNQQGRKMLLKTLTALLAIVLSCSACTTQYGQQEQAGMIIGGVLGGVLGAQIGEGSGRDIAIIAGTLAGSAIGSAVGRSMDDTDRLRAAQTLETVRTGVSSRWRNPDTDISYTMVPTRTYETKDGPCREYSIDALIENRSEQVHGTACRREDGAWVIQN